MVILTLLFHHQLFSYLPGLLLIGQPFLSLFSKKSWKNHPNPETTSLLSAGSGNLEKPLMEGARLWTLDWNLPVLLDGTQVIFRCTRDYYNMATYCLSLRLHWAETQRRNLQMARRMSFSLCSCLLYIKNFLLANYTLHVCWHRPCVVFSTPGSFSSEERKTPCWDENEEFPVVSLPCL